MTSPKEINGTAVASAQPRPGLSCSSRGVGQQVPKPDQVVGGGDEEEVPLDPLTTAVPQLAQAADGLHPGEDLFDALPHMLTHGIARMSRRSDH